MGEQAKGYLHGYSSDEQKRLASQARFLESMVYEKVDYSRVQTLLEVGCGVGAQTEILLERFPDLKIIGIDAAPEQIAVAQQRLAPAIEQGRVKLHVADALKLPLESDSLDAAFVCFFLEHVGDPVAVLKETRRVLKPGGIIYCTEVHNATFFVHPYCPATFSFWNAFNEHQEGLGGDPYVGAKLGNYLLSSGFQNIGTEAKIYHYDSRMPKVRTQMFDYWINLLLSGAPELLKAGKTTQATIDEMAREMNRLKDEPNAVFFYGPVQARGQAL